MDEEAHEGHRGAEVVSVLVEEGAVGVEVFQEVVAAVSLHEEEGVRGVVSHGVVVDYLIPYVPHLTCVDIPAFSGLRIRCSRNKKLVQLESSYAISGPMGLDHGVEGCLQREHFKILKLS